jgi:hypothetical protein
MCVTHDTAALPGTAVSDLVRVNGPAGCALDGSAGAAGGGAVADSLPAAGVALWAFNVLMLRNDRWRSRVVLADDRSVTLVHCPMWHTPGAQCRHAEGMRELVQLHNVMVSEAASGERS